MKLISGGNIIFNKLIQNSVKNVWLYSGGAVMPLIDCFNNQKSINYFINTNEQNLGHSATGYARSLNKPGVCIVTSGPGLTNMITPMLDAQNDSTPLIVLSGQVPLNAMGTNAFQEAPATELTSVFTKWSYSVKKTEELSCVIDKAFNIAMSGKKGVVHIDIPKCVATSSVDLDEQTDIYSMNNSITESINCETNIRHILKDEHKNTIKQIMSIVNKSERPVLYIGAGCIHQYNRCATATN